MYINMITNAMPSVKFIANQGIRDATTLPRAPAQYRQILRVACACENHGLHRAHVQRIQPPQYKPNCCGRDRSDQVALRPGSLQCLEGCTERELSSRKASASSERALAERSTSDPSSRRKGSSCISLSLTLRHGSWH